MTKRKKLVRNLPGGPMVILPPRTAKRIIREAHNSPWITSEEISILGVIKSPQLPLDVTSFVWNRVLWSDEMKIELFGNQHSRWG